MVEKEKVNWRGRVYIVKQPEKSQGSPEGDEIPQGYPTAGKETVGRKPQKMRRGKDLERKLWQEEMVFSRCPNSSFSSWHFYSWVRNSGEGKGHNRQALQGLQRGQKDQGIQGRTGNTQVQVTVPWWGGVRKAELQTPGFSKFLLTRRKGQAGLIACSSPRAAGNRRLKGPTGLCVCMLSDFSCVQLFVTAWSVACQAPLSMEFSR